MSTPGATEAAAPTEVDVLVVGAGISGIDTGYRLQTMSPDLSYAIVEARDAIGGTWDLFRYPGVRSDSDMFTLGFPFEPWRSNQSVVDGASIREYIRATARKYGIDRRIHFGHKVIRSSWDSPSARWTVECETADGPRTFRARWVHNASGYYSYDEGYTPDYPGREAFAGDFVHPQFWPEDLDVSGKKVIVIGSGATAVTLVPALAERGADVTMLQRSPSYIFAHPAKDGVAAALQKVLPPLTAHRLIRRKNIVMALGFYAFTRVAPKAATKLITSEADKATRGGEVTRADFTPAYKPWDQRLCLVPDGDLFDAVKAGGARIVTDTIETFEADGIRTSSGRFLEADVIVSATGLRMTAVGNVPIVVDGEQVRLPEHFLHRGVMVSGVPNSTTSIGYINASWTLRADLVAQYVCRLLNRLTESGADYVIAEAPTGMTRRNAIEMESGYLQRAMADFPGQGDGAPWTMPQNYFTDRRYIGRADLDEGLRWMTGAALP